MSKLKQWWSDLNSSLWFVPTLMVLAAMLAAYLLVSIDNSNSNKWTADYPLLFGAGADGARGMLAAIAGSMITVAGLIFSLTLSTLAQVSSQYTSRLLRNFMRDRTNQVVMGFFVSIFVYSLMVLRTIRGGDEGKFVPPIAVSFALVLALVSIGMLIFFIHHIASSIQAANIIGRAAKETHEGIARIFPQQLGNQADSEAQEELRVTDMQWYPIQALATGYLQNIDNDGLLEFACDLDVVVRMEHRMGDFVTEGMPLVSVGYYNEAHQPTADETHQLNDYFSIGIQRTIDQQDVAFGFRQIVDIALKALSPGINDTTTAVMCVDYLGALMAFVATRRLHEPLRASDGRVRVKAKVRSFEDYVRLAFDQVRGSGDANVAILLRQLTSIQTIVRSTGSYGRRQALRRQCDHIREAAERALTTEYERNQVQARVAETEALLTKPYLTLGQMVPMGYE